MYHHQQYQGDEIPLVAGKAVCVGRNYVEHIQELNNPTPSEPLLFIKPTTALVDISKPLQVPQQLGQCHNELELAVLIQHTLSKVSPEQVRPALWGVGLALDLTLRDVQSELKAKGLPWERAKSFDGACPLSPFLPLCEIEDLQDLHFTLRVNSQMRQQGYSGNMIWPISQLIAQISQVFTLCPGDVVLTGTPKGVGPLLSGDHLHLRLNRMQIDTQVN